MIHLEAIVSRKTPIDGRFEIPESLALRLADLNEPLRIQMHGEEAQAGVEDMACTCAKAGGNHHHHFISAELLKSLPAGANARLTIDIDQGTISIDV